MAANPIDGLLALMQAETQAQEAILDDLVALMQAHTTLVDQAVAWYHRRTCHQYEGCACDMAEEYFSGCSNAMLRDLLDPEP